ncbi:hypothetical protein DXG01_013904, partial [Tephrocybe rancida]
TQGLLSLSKPEQQRTPPPQRPRAKAPAHRFIHKSLHKHPQLTLFRIPPQAESGIPSDPFVRPSSTVSATPPRPKQQRRRPPQPIPIAAPSPVLPICDDLSNTDDAAAPIQTRRSRPRRRPAPTFPPVTTTAPHPQGSARGTTNALQATAACSSPCPPTSPALSSHPSFALSRLVRTTLPPDPSRLKPQNVAVEPPPPASSPIPPGLTPLPPFMVP